MKPPKLRFGLGTLFLVIAASAGFSKCLRYYLYDRHDYKYAGRGWHDVYVIAADGSRQAVLCYDPSWQLGHAVGTDELVAILNTRISDLQERPKPGGSSSKVGARKVLLAAELLTEVRHQVVLDLLVKLLEDPVWYISDFVTGCLTKLGDKRALPHLLARLQGNNQPPDALVRAIYTLGDATTADYLFQNHGAIMWQFVPKGIDQMTGLSSKEFLEDWNKSLPINSPQFATALREWWEKNKHKVIDPT